MSKPKFRTCKDSRKRKRCVNKNEARRKIVSIIFLGPAMDKINNISSIKPTVRRINEGSL